jgi:hypothetical protein
LALGGRHEFVGHGEEKKYVHHLTFYLVPPFLPSYFSIRLLELTSGSTGIAVRAHFEFMEKLGVDKWCFHDRDIAPDGKTLEACRSIMLRCLQYELKI